MKLNSADQKRGVQWLLGAGVFALALVGFLRWADEALTNSDREIQLEQDLLDIRRAAATVAPGQNDGRVSQPAKYAPHSSALLAEDKDFLLQGGSEEYLKDAKKASSKGYH